MTKKVCTVEIWSMLSALIKNSQMFRFCTYQLIQSTLGNSSTRETTANSFFRLLYLIAPLLLGDYSAFFPRFALLITKFTISCLKEPRQRSILIFVGSLRARGYFCPTFFKATLDLRSTRAPTKENTKEHEKNLFSPLKGLP